MQVMQPTSMNYYSPVSPIWMAVGAGNLAGVSRSGRWSAARRAGLGGAGVTRVGPAGSNWGGAGDGSQGNGSNGNGERRGETAQRGSDRPWVSLELADLEVEQAGRAVGGAAWPTVDVRAQEEAEEPDRWDGLYC